MQGNLLQITHMRTTNVPKMPRRIGAALLVVAALLLATFALPVRTWRTGELPAPPLPLKKGDSLAVPAGRLWIDTDAACGAAGHADVDDCFALLILARASGPRIVGISSVFGNAPVEVTDRTTRALVARLGSGTATPPPVFRGSAAPLSADGRRAAAPAHTALQAALKEQPLTIVALGPLTNIAASLEGHPELQARVSAIVAVMGHRPGHLFHPAEGKGSGGMLFGHGPVFTDFNYAQDRVAALSVIRMGLPVTLIPYDAARGTRLTAADLDRMAAAGGAAGWVALRSRPWLDYWQDRIGLNGFYPFDLLAAAYVTEPGYFHCATAGYWIAPDPMFSWIPAADSLLVGVGRERPKDVRAAGTAVYCPQIGPGLHDWAMERLTAQP